MAGHDFAAAPGQAGRPDLGASAACATLIGLYAVRYYRATLHFVGLPIRAHVVVVVTLFLLIEIGGGLWNLLAGDASDGVAHWAHIGGFIFGSGLRQRDAAGRSGREGLSYRRMRRRRCKKSVPGAAIKKWETLLLREPQNTSARRELARAWLLLGDREQAEQEYRSGLFAAHAATISAWMPPCSMRKCAKAVFSPPTSPRGSLRSGQRAGRPGTVRAGGGHAAPGVPRKTASDAEAETALLKVISLYVHHLDRREEARSLLAVFYERYANSAFRSLADDLHRATERVSVRLTRHL